MLTTEDQDNTANKEVGADVVKEEVKGDVADPSDADVPNTEVPDTDVPTPDVPAPPAPPAPDVPEPPVEAKSKREKPKEVASDPKLRAAIAYLARRTLDPSGVEDFKNLYPSVFE